MNNFDLENAIGQWRKRLSGREAFTEADLDEMEGHLRDEIDALIASGIPDKEAFFETVRGSAKTLTYPGGSTTQTGSM